MFSDLWQWGRGASGRMSPAGGRGAGQHRAFLPLQESIQTRGDKAVQQATMHSVEAGGVGRGMWREGEWGEVCGGKYRALCVGGGWGEGSWEDED